MNKRNEIIPNNLLAARLNAGLRQKQVAILLGVKHEDRISHWEKGKGVPNIFNLFKLSKIYKSLPHELYPQLLLEDA